MTPKKKVRVWDKQAKYIGDFEVPENQPQLVMFGGKVYSYHETWNVYTEMEEQIYTVPSLWTTNVKL